jgi:hypothetical protein
MMWTPQTGEQIFRLPEQPKDVWDLAWSPDGKAFVTACTDTTVLVWNTTFSQAPLSRDLPESDVRVSAWSPDGRVFALGFADGTAALLDGRTGCTIETRCEHGNWVDTLAWSPCGDWLAISHTKGELWAWNQPVNRAIHLFKYEESVISLSWSRDGDVIKAEAWDYTNSRMTPHGDRVEQTIKAKYWSIQAGTELSEGEGVSKKWKHAKPSRGSKPTTSRVSSGEAVFLHSESDSPFAWFEAGPKLTSSDGVGWGGASGGDVYMVRLEQTGTHGPEGGVNSVASGDQIVLTEMTGQSNHWMPYESGNTIGHPGSERGVILEDEEYRSGARITLECRAHGAQFAITCGAYGLFLHTQFFSQEDDARREFADMKNELGQIVDLSFDPTASEQIDSILMGAASRFVERFT